jgi:hypothetical protein
MLGVLTPHDEGSRTLEAEYDGRRVIGIDLHPVSVGDCADDGGWRAAE